MPYGFNAIEDDGKKRIGGCVDLRMSQQGKG